MRQQQPQELQESTLCCCYFRCTCCNCRCDCTCRLLYDAKGRFVVHRISAEEANYKLCKVRSMLTQTWG
jgi:hypothetical protein